MKPRILVCDDEDGLRHMLGLLFRRAGYDVDVVESVRPAIARIDAEPPYDVIVTDLLMPDGSGMEVLEHARNKEESTQVVMITAFATTEQAVEAMRKGAYDYVQKPFPNEALRATVEKALEKRAIVDENRALRAERESAFRLGELVGKSAAMHDVMELVRRVADAPASVLITGESGTGKEIVARALHAQGGRRDHAFVAVNCGALPESLMESELFGHERGAFTGATTKQEGLFRAAHGGTIFLDEVGELPATLQVKLLRVLQDRKVRAVGGREEVEVDVRVVAATNRDIDADVESGRFRQDLFYRLNVIRIAIPALRERRDDIPLLAQHFLKKHSALARRRLSFTADALRYLAAQPYPGNVRQLENAVERAVTLTRAEDVGLRDVLTASGTPASGITPPSVPPEGLDLDAHLGAVERTLLLEALDRAEGNRTQAAKLLHTTFRSLRYRLAKYGIGEEGDSEDEPEVEADR